MAETVVDTGNYFYPKNHGANGEARARDHEIYARRQFFGANHVQTGGALTHATNTHEVTLGSLRVYIDGRQVMDADKTWDFILPANETRYIMVDRAGRVFHRDTNNPDADTEILLWEATTDGSGVSDAVDHRRFAAFTEIGVGDDEYVYLSTNRTKYLKWKTADSVIEVAGATKFLNAASFNANVAIGRSAPLIASGNSRYLSVFGGATAEGILELGGPRDEEGDTLGSIIFVTDTNITAGHERVARIDGLRHSDSATTGGKLLLRVKALASTTMNTIIEISQDDVRIYKNLIIENSGIRVDDDVEHPLVMKKSTGALTTAPGAGLGLERWEPGTNPGTLKKVAYAGTSTTGVTLIDNVGAGN